MIELLSNRDNSLPEYRIKLELFEGPMDLLLKLIEKRELDITKLSLAAVTDQYLDHLKLVEQSRPDDIADFLVLAARLLLIKSRELLPRPSKPEEEEEKDPGEALARQLREYRRFKQIARDLRAKEELGLRNYARLAAPPKLKPRMLLEDVSLKDIAQALERALKSLPPAPPVDNVVRPLKIRVEDRIERILHLSRTNRSFSFQRFLMQGKSRMEVIVSFLAVLELIKRRQIIVRQEHRFGEILIEEHTSLDT